MIMATATVPDSLSTFLRDQHPTTHRLITPNLHRLPATVSVDKVNWSGGNWRADVLLEIRRALIEDAREGKMDSQVIVFTNKNTKAEEFAQYLEEKDVKNVVLTSEGNRRIRGSSKPIAGASLSPSSLFLLPSRELIRLLPTPLGFINNATDQTKAVRAHERALEEYRKDPTATPPVIYQKRPDPSAPRVLITTGLLARGIDFANTVSTAILLDEPRNALDFLHRAGRVGRAGANGKVIIFTKQKQPKIRQGGGKGRGGAIWKTVSVALSLLSSASTHVLPLPSHRSRLLVPGSKNQTAGPNSSASRFVARTRSSIDEVGRCTWPVSRCCRDVTPLSSVSCPSK